MKVEIIQQKGYNFLWIDDYLWMWDIPRERELQKQIADKCFGRVLIAGYGLGVVQRYLLDNKWVTSVLTVEKHKQVIDECYRVYGNIHGHIVISDFFDYHSPYKFDCVIGDIWEDIEPERLDDYKKFKDKAQELVISSANIFAWGKDYYEYLIGRSK